MWAGLRARRGTLAWRRLLVHRGLSAKGRRVPGDAEYEFFLQYVGILGYWSYRKLILGILICRLWKSRPKEKKKDSKLVRRMAHT